MKSDDDELGAELQELLDHERPLRALPAARRDAILRGLETSLATATASTSADHGRGATTRTFGSRLVRSGALLLLGGAVGAALHATIASPRVVTVPGPTIVVSEVAPAIEPIAPIASAPVASTPPPPPTEPAPKLRTALPDKSIATSPSAPVASAVEARPSSLGEERALLERARAALGRRDPLSALEALADHARQAPSGKLAEERDALVVQALAASGRADDARRKATEFHTRYPTSVFASRVDTTIRELSTPR